MPRGIPFSTCKLIVPPIQGEAQISSDAQHGRLLQLRVGIGRQKHHRTVGNELHHHAQVLGDRLEQHRTGGQDRLAGRMRLGQQLGRRLAKVANLIFQCL